MARHQLGFTYAIIAATMVAARGANDWSKPCFNGECAYDIPVVGQSASMKIVGAPHAIADITPSAGWVVLECDQHALSQDIRLVCNSDNEEAAGCNHLFSGDGPVHKFVRMPESCGPYPFGRIANFRVDENQSIPEHAASQIQRRDGLAPQVISLKIDNEYKNVDAEKYGKVYAASMGVNLPNVDTNFAIPQDIGMKEVADAFVIQAMEDIKDAVARADENYYVTHPDGLLTPIDNAEFHKHEDKTKSPIEWGSKTPVKLEVQLEKNPTCKKADLKATLDASLSTTIHGTAGYFGSAGVADLKDSSLLALMSNIAQFEVNAEHELEVKVSVEGTIKHEFEVLKPVPIPHAAVSLGIVTVGLQFGVDGEVHMNAKVGVEAKAGFKWGVKKVTLSIPPSTGHAQPYAKDGHFDVSLSRNDDGMTAHGEIALSATPKLIIGVTAGSISVNFSGFIGFKAGLALVAGLTGGAKRSADSDWYCAKLKAQFEASIGGEAKLFSLFHIPSKEVSFWDKELELWTHGNCPEPAEKRSTILSLQSRAPHTGSSIQKLKDSLKCAEHEKKPEKADSKKGLDEHAMHMKDHKKH
ncbi:hypothetical protein ONZ45_g16359 [Pleurotus djamor]|nr:hypothetical protein ONZ45_g16359 [Pleurotus djamor]